MGARPWTGSFSELLAEARRGSPDAVDALYREYWGAVAGAIRRRLVPVLRRRFDTLDLAHSVFAQVLRDLERFEDRGEQAFRHWLYIKAENHVRSKLRRVAGRDGGRLEGRISDAAEPGDDETPSHAAAEAELRGQVGSALASLDDLSRRVVELRMSDDALTFAEIALQTGIASGEAARKRYARALVRLRGEFDGGAAAGGA